MRLRFLTLFLLPAFLSAAVFAWAQDAAPVTLISLPGKDSIDTRRYVGASMRRVLEAPATTRAMMKEVDDQGRIVLNPEEDLPALSSGALGWRVRMRFADVQVAEFSGKRVGYAFIRRRALDGEPIDLEPPGQPTQWARVQAREVWPMAREHRVEAGPLPPGAQLHVALALQQDWRVERGTGARFTLLVDDEPMLEEEVRVEYFQNTPAWKTRTVGLEALAGEKVTVTFRTRPLNPARKALRFAYPLWGSPVITGDVPPDRDRPNVVLVSLDTLRADHLGCYGYGRNTSPHLDALAEESVLFEQAIAPAPWTTPSHASLFTGLHPAAHRAGVHSAGYYLGEHHLTLAELARANGYLTAAITEGIAVRAQMGFAQGFDLYSDGLSPDRHRVHTAESTFSQALDWVRRRGKAPFFLFVHTYEPHAPFDPPSPWLEEFADPAFDGARLAASPKDAKTPDERQHIIDRYDGSIAYTDASLHRFVEGLRELGLLDQTELVIFSDHGEEFWEHGALGHVDHLHDETLHVPLIWRGPGKDRPRGRVETQVALQDVFATLARGFGWPGAAAADSHDLRPLMPGGRGSYARMRVISQLVYHDPSQMRPNGIPIEWASHSVRTPHWKYIRSNRAWVVKQGRDAQGEPVFDASLFNLREDPGEKRDVLGDHMETAREMRGRLEGFLERQRREHRRENGEKPPSALDEDDIESLRSMGYL